MFCPECGAEFKEGITTCDECEVALVADPPSEPEVESYVDVLETSDVSAIPVIKTVLEAAGIPYRIPNEDAVGLFPFEALSASADSAGEIVFQVPEDRAEEARVLLEEGASGGETAEDGEDA